MYLGSFDIDDYVGIPAATHNPSTGNAYAPTVLTYSIYEEGGTTGIDENVNMVPGSPFDSIVGCYWIRRQLTTAAGFEAGKNYLVVIKATVKNVSAIQQHTFQIAAKVDARYLGGTAQTGRDIGASVLLAASQLAVKKNVALNNFEFAMFDSTDHTPKAGLTVTAERSIDGGALSACANSPAEISGGAYKINLADTDLNGNVVLLKFSATGADAEFILLLPQA